MTSQVVSFVKWLCGSIGLQALWGLEVFISLGLWVLGSRFLCVCVPMCLCISDSLDLWISGSLGLFVSVSLCLCVSAAERIAVKVRDLKVFWSSAVG